MARNENSLEFRWLKHSFYEACEYKYNDINPFDGIDNFLDHKIGELRWGNDSDIIEMSKKVFAEAYYKTLRTYDVSISKETVINGLADDERNNLDVVRFWFDNSTFN